MTFYFFTELEYKPSDALAIDLFLEDPGVITSISLYLVDGTGALPLRRTAVGGVEDIAGVLLFFEVTSPC